jgi:thiamine-monophosphate kinase
MGTHVLGGNLKEAVDGVVRCEATAFGLVPTEKPMSRVGAEVGNILVAVGGLGSFWAAALWKQRTLELPVSLHEPMLKALLRPQPQLTSGIKLRERGLARSCTDASDGLYAAISSLTIEQGLGFELRPDVWDYPPEVVAVSAELGVEPLRLALGFGDLQLVAAVSVADLPKVNDVAVENGVGLTLLGRVTDSGTFQIRIGKDLRILSNFDNERFSTTSQFTAGIDAFADRLLTQSLFAS